MSDRTPLPRDEEVRELIRSEREHNVAVQASAGTGKTTLIVDRVIGLVRDGMPIDRLVVVTFTRAAASELRMRIRSELRKHDLKVPLAKMSGAWVDTIHGFASRVLREHFNLTGADPSFSTSEKHFDPMELSLIWDAWLLGLPPDVIEEFGDVLEKVPVDRLRSMILAIESRRWLVDRDMLGHGQDVLQKFGDQCLPELSSLLGSCLNHENDRFKGLTRLSDTVKKLLAGSLRLEAGELRELYEMLPGRNGYTKKDWAEPRLAQSTAKAIRDRFMDAVAPVLLAEPLTDPAWRLCEEIATELRELWDADRSRLSFNDLLHLAWRAIARSGRLATCLRQRFDHVLIDEFQDTSIDQVNLFRSFLEEAETLPQGMVTVVADDKQSIYGWRNADIETYRKFLEQMRESGAIVENIVTNFRSTRSIIRFVNAFGAELFAGQSPEEGPYGCRYSPIEPRPEAPEGDPVLVLSLPEAPDDLPVPMTTAPYRAVVQAEWFASQVREGLEKGCSPGDFALLMRSTTHMSKFIEVLEREGIPYFVEATRDYRARPEVADIRELLRCLIHPNDRLAWLHTLRSMFFGLDDMTITRAVDSGTTDYLEETGGCPEAVSAANSFLRMLRQSALTLPLPDLLAVILFDSEIVPAIAASGYQSGRRLGNLQFILEKALTGAVSTVEELLLELDEQFAPSRAEEPSVAPSDGSAVTITTIHKSKGLSWKHVVLAAQSRGGRNSDEVLIANEHDRKAALDMGLKVPASDSKTVRLRTAYWHEISLREKHRSAAESRRLVYVAATRAEDSLTIFVTPQNEGKNHPAGIVWDSVRRAREEDPGCCRFEDMPPMIPAGSGRSSPRLSVSIPAVRPETDLFPVRPSVPNWQGEGAKVGDMVHSVLEKLDFSDPEGWFLERREELQRLHGKHFDAVRRLCLAFFRMELPFDLSSARVVGREYPYTVMTEKGLRSRIIDLLLEDDEGLIVVDYKTDAFEGRSSKKVADEYMETQKHYVTDMCELFRRPVRGYLVFLRENTVMGTHYLSGVTGTP